MYGTMRSASHVYNILRPYNIISSLKPAVTVNLTRVYSKKEGDDAYRPRGAPKQTNEFRSRTIRPSTISPQTCPPTKDTPCPPGGPKPDKDCGKANAMKEVPQPSGSWNDGPKQRQYGKQLAIGIFIAAVSLFAFYKYGMDTSKKERKGPLSTKLMTKKLRKPKVVFKQPASSKEIPTKVPYLLIGGGTASFSAFRSIKSLDPTAKVLVISNESYYPYLRTPLSKEVWFNERHPSKHLVFTQWNGTERSLFYEPEEFYVECKNLMEEGNGGVAVARGWQVKNIDVFGRKAYLEDGHVIEYDKCLIATGSTPKNLPVFKEAHSSIKERVALYRDIFDYEDLEDVLATGIRKITIIGGGFLGSELACGLARRGKNQGYSITQIFRESGNMGKVLPEYLSLWSTHKVQQEGVRVLPNTEVDDISLEKDGVVLHLSSGEKVATQYVIVAVGAEPNTELAESSHLEVDGESGGYLVNAELMARSHLWIAGDCTCFYDTKLGRRRVEHHDHAVISGRLAGENMTGAGKPYVHQSMFWSDLGPEVGYQAIGIVDSSLPTVGVFAKATDKDTPKAVVSESGQGDRAASEAVAKPVKPAKSTPAAPADDDDYGKGVIFYLRDDIVVGILLWNVFQRMSVARRVLSDERRYEDLNEVAKLFNIHEDQE